MVDYEQREIDDDIDSLVRRIETKRYRENNPIFKMLYNSEILLFITSMLWIAGLMVRAYTVGNGLITAFIFGIATVLTAVWLIIGRKISNMIVEHYKE